MSMKRMLALLTTLLLVFSLFPATAFATDEPPVSTEPTAAEATATPEPTAKPVDSEEPSEEPTAEPTPIADVTPEPEQIYLHLVGFDRQDSDGTGYLSVSCEEGEELSLKASCESNGALSYRWQLLDTESSAEDPYVDIDTDEEPTADQQTLSITADDVLLGVEDALRCVVTATKGEAALQAVYYFTLEETQLAIDTQTAERGGMSVLDTGEPTYVGSTEELLTALANHDSTIYTDESFTLTSDIEILSDVTFVVTNTTLTIPDGFKVKNSGYFGIHHGTIDVYGTIANRNTVWCGYGSTLNFISSGTYQIAADEAQVTLFDDGADSPSAINGLTPDQIVYESKIHTAADWDAAFSRCTQGYHNYRFMVAGSIVLTGTIEIPSNMVVFVEDTLTIDASASLTLNGTIDLQNGLFINNGSLFNNGKLTGQGTFVNNNFLTGEGENSIYTPITNQTELQNALDSGTTFVTLSQDITLSNTLEIPSGVQLSIDHATLTVPTGVDVVNHGTISSDNTGALLLVEGAIQNANSVYSWNGGVITFQNGGTYVSTNGNSQLEISDYGTATTSEINGIDSSVIGYHCTIRTEQDYAVALTRASSAYRYNFFHIDNDFTMTLDTEIPAYLTLWTPNDFTISANKTLTIYGTLDCADTSTLTNYGTINNQGTLNINGTYVGDGIITGNGEINNNVTISTEDELRAAVESGKSSITITDDIRLSSNLAIASNEINLRLDGAVLTIPDNITFTSNAWIDLFGSGGIVIESGGCLENTNGIMVNDAIFSVESGGTYVGTDGNLYQQLANGASITGVGLADITLRFEVNNEDEIDQALMYAGDGYRSIEIHQVSDITLSRSLSLSDETWYFLDDDRNVVLRVPFGKTLTNNQYMNIGIGCTLQIDAGATLINNGYIAVNGDFSNEGILTGDGGIGYGEDSVFTWNELKAAVEKNSSQIYIDDNITIEESITIPSGTKLNLDDDNLGSLTVPSGVTLTLEQDTELYMLAGAINILSGATLVNYGWVNLNGGTFTTYEGSTFLDYASVDLVGTAVGRFNGTYTPGQDHWFCYTDTQGGATISGIDLKHVFYWADVKTAEDITRNAAKVSVGYRYLFLYLKNELSLPDNFLIPAKVYLSVAEGCMLTITSGNTASVSGWLSIEEGATLEIQPGATLHINDDGYLNLVGTLINAGKISGNYEYSAVVRSDADLRAAEAAGVNHFTVIGSFQLESDFTLDSGKSMTIEDVTLTIPNRVKFTSYGQIDVKGGTLLAKAGGSLENRGSIWVYRSTSNGAVTIVTGSTYIMTEDAWISFAYGEANITGIPTNKIGVSVLATNESELKNALALNLSVYRDATINITAPITLTSNAKNQAGVLMQILMDDEHAGEVGLTIANNATLTNAGTLCIEDGNTLLVNGTLANVEKGSLEIKGTLINHGSVTYADDASAHCYVSTEEELIDAAGQNNGIITYEGDITLSGELDIHDSVILEAGNGATLTIDDGARLNLGASRIWLFEGSLVVAEGGTLTLADHGYISLWGSGKLTVNGELNMQGSFSKIYLREDDTATIEGISEKNCAHVYAYKNTYSESEMLAALSYYEDSPYEDVLVYPAGNTTISEDVTVPNSVDLDICDGAVLTIPAGRTLTIAEGGCLRIETSGSLVVNGTLENYGKMELSSASVTITGTLIDHSKNTSYTLQASTLSQLKIALSSSLRPLTIECTGFTINSNITIPSGITVIFNTGTTSSIVKGYSVTNNGTLVTVGTLVNAGTIINNNAMKVNWKSLLTNNGTVTNNKDIDVYGSLVNNATIAASGEQAIRFYLKSTRSGTNASGSWYRTEGQRISSMSITGADTIIVGESLGQTFGVSVLPTDAWSREVTWEIVEGLDYATINATTGEITATAEGTVKIRATATDGSDATAEKTFTTVDYSLAITGQNWVLAGKSLQLTSAFEPSNLTGTSTRWSLNAEDAAYATISATGLLTAKLVTEQHTVTVTAASVDGMAEKAEKVITIYPAVSTVKIMKADVDVTGKTLELNSYAGSSMELRATMYPEDANVGVNWNLSATDALTMTTGEGGMSAILTPVEGKTGLITLTAKSNDGSGVSSTVKIQLIAQSSGVTVSGAVDGTLYAGKKVQLKATFADPQPSNSSVKWVLAPEYDAYATLSSTGLLTARAVTDTATVQVFAVPLDGGPSSPAYEVTIQPFVSAVVISRGDAIITGTTQAVDMGHETRVALGAKTWPDAASDEVTWASSAPLIASVDADGNVSILRTGTASITATATDGSLKSAKVILSITSLPQEIAVSAPIEKLCGGASATYMVKDKATGNVLPTSLVRWTLAEGNSAYASITTAGVLKTNVVPTVQTIKLRAEVIGNESIAFDTVIVTIYPAAQSLSLNNGATPVSGTTLLFNAKNGATQTIPESYRLSALILPADAQQDVVWSSSNTIVARVTNGVVTPVWNATTSAFNKGTAVITAKAKDGSSKSSTVTISVAEGVESILFKTVSGETELGSGKSVQLSATASNATATNKNISIRVVDGAQYVTLSSSGLLTAKVVYEDQSVKLVAGSEDGCAVEELNLLIKAQDNPVQIYNWDETTNYSGQWIQIDANDPAYTKIGDIQLELLAKDEAGYPAVTWSVAPSSVAKVVTIADHAQLQALATGIAVVTAKTSDGRVASFTVEIYRGATSLTIAPPTGMDAENLTLASGKTMQLSGAFTPATAITTKGIVWSLAEAGASLQTPILANDVATISSSGLLTARPNLTEPVEVKIVAYSANAPYLTSNNQLTVTIQPIVTGLDIVCGDTILSNAAATLDYGDSAMQLDVMAYPSDANQSVVWTSSSKLIATVSDTGLVTAVKAGTVTITAKTTDGSAKSVSFKLTVAVRVKTVEITSAKGFDVRGGSTLQLGVAFTPEAPTDKRVTWSLDPQDAQFASISSGGLLTTKALTSAVTVQVTVKSVDQPDATFTQPVTIRPTTTKVLIVDETETDVTGTTLTLDLNSAEAIMLSAQNLPTVSGGAIQGVTWKTSSSTILKVTDGKLEPVMNTKTGLYNTGTVTITATASDGSGKTASVKVVVAYLVRELKFATGLTVQGGKSLTLKPTFDPIIATNKTVKWAIQASDTPYATISSAGVLTTKKVTSPRDIVVICMAQDGSGVTCEITITIT